MHSRLMTISTFGKNKSGSFREIPRNSCIVYSSSSVRGVWFCFVLAQSWRCGCCSTRGPRIRRLCRVECVRVPGCLFARIPSQRGHIISSKSAVLGVQHMQARQPSFYPCFVGRAERLLSTFHYFTWTVISRNVRPTGLRGKEG